MSNRLRQPDLFDTFKQGEIFDSSPLPQVPTAADARARLTTILGELRRVPAVPSAASTLAVYEIIVPQMARWLPDEEGRQFVSEFFREVAKLRLAD